MSITLHEKYRPKCWDEVVGQDKAIKCLHGMRDRTGLGGHAFWIAGPSGTGKTTIARLIAAEVADELNILELDANSLSAGDIQKLERSHATFGFGDKAGHAVIVNEIHWLTAKAQSQLLTTLERVRKHVVWVFTTTDDGQQVLFEGIDGSALMSRCTIVPMSRQGLCETFAAKLRENAMAEGLDGKPIKSYIELMKQCRNNLRAGYGKVEAGVMKD